MPRPSTSSRPVTSSGRPTTARPDTADTYFDSHHPQYTQSQEYDDIYEEDEESDAEDVFAFARPPTGTSANMQTSLYSNNIAPDGSIPSPSVAYPPRTFDPLKTHDTHNPVAGPSGFHSRHAYPYPQSPAVESPPSTSSQPDDDPYRLRRVAPPASSRGSGATSRRSAISSAISSREVHVSLPPTREVIDEELAVEGKDGLKPRPPSSSTTFPTLDSRDGSIK
ncbi:hypothetical protein BXZ70DRAFT_713515 [Cristinia sonorae]|uniref:Uncharacterized protein n=1 Tax=Cristinia sonorae TaxID=1940300 RepID=A0A8K0UTN3_9AGAR|nr:hypothetical protein BXZ70DRAFT_713515 [Cristinia sonorae]